MRYRTAGLLLAAFVPLLARAEAPSIEALREAAEQAFQERRWTTPAEGSANALANQILDLDPNDDYALELKERIVAQYLNLVERMLARGELTAARAQLIKARRIKPAEPALLSLGKRLERAERKLEDRGTNEVIAAFNAMDKQATYAGWQRFLELYPDSEFTDYAKRQLESLSRGRLRVVSATPGAAVELDGQPAGQTPLELDEVPPGEYMVRVERRFHEPFERRVVVAPTQEVEVVADLLPSDPVYGCAARHKHTFGTCSGRLSFHRDRVQYTAYDGEHSVILLYKEVGVLDITHPGRVSVSSVRTGKNYNFELLGARLDAELITLLSRLSKAR